MKTLFNTVTFFAILICNLLSQGARANGISAQTLNPSTSDHYVLTEDAFLWSWPPKSKYYFGLNYNYVKDPLIAYNSATGTRDFNIVDSVQTFDLMVGWRLSQRLGVFVGAPIHFIRYGGGAPFGFPSGDSSGIGDAKILLKWRLTKGSAPIAFTLHPELHLPTGKSLQFGTDGAYYLSGRIIGETNLSEKLQLAVNLGYGYAADAGVSSVSAYTGIEGAHRLLFAVGTLWKFDQKWGANLEITGNPRLPFSQSQTPTDVYLGGRYEASDHWVFTLGGGANNAFRTSGPSYRVIAGVRVAPWEEDAAPTPTPMPEATPALAIYKERKIEIVEPIMFKHDSSELLPRSKEVLNHVAAVITEHLEEIKKVLIEGHTNHIGKPGYNMRLSERRANSVRNYLMLNGISESLLEANGYGDTRPVVPINKPEAIERNRRTEFVIQNK